MVVSIRPPMSGGLTLRDAMDRLFDQAFSPALRGTLGEASRTEQSNYVPTNLWEDGSNFYIHVQAPGLDAESVDITATNNMLVISGKLTMPAPEGAKALWQEWTGAQFRRQINLPARYNADGVEATYKDGVLTVTVPKPEEMKPKSIKVQIAE
ncbi:MAG: Hsp20/alpha crystallin family protein [Chloroflexota bacterium]